MTSIYDLHDKSFPQVSAFAILRDGEPVAKIAFKFPKDGAGRLYAYVHWLGSEMVRGHANGYGYDKRSAACANAAKHAVSRATKFWSALEKDDGYHWDHHLREAGFVVFQTV